MDSLKLQVHPASFLPHEFRGPSLLLLSVPLHLHAWAICCKFNQFIIELLKRNLPYKYNGVVIADNLYRIMYIIINPCMHYLAYICIATSTIYVRGGSCTIQFTTASLCVLHPPQMPGDVKSTPYSKARFSIAYFEDTQNTDSS